MRRFSIPALAVAALVALAGCSGGSTSAPTAPASAAAPSSAPSAAAASAPVSAPAGAGPSVAIKDFAFAPATIDAKVGQTITWTNQDSTAHTVTLDDKSADSGNIAPNATYSRAFAQAGSFAYHCEIHKQMVGTVTVSG